MTTFLRRYQNDTVNKQLDVALNSWDLDEQLIASEIWLNENEVPSIDGGFLALDIGFNRRSVAIAGYTIKPSLMKMLSERNIYLWLSDYRNEETAQQGDAPDPGSDADLASRRRLPGAGDL